MGDNTVSSIDETIQAAVSARIEAEVARALAGDEVIGRYVTAALQQPIEPDRYSRNKVPYLTHVLQKAIRKSTEKILKEVIDEQKDAIREQIRLGIKRQCGQIADAAVQQLSSESFDWRADVKVNIGIDD